ncbi:SDR family oxidoreductase [Pseudomonas sp. 10B1]|uniref:SDR family oxidoreductase n=1 Tax=unclassified Pseudomonas TaxID=196821 RepID=UPI002AB4B180|nr:MULTISPECIES: SDR family oxidoreductase [unclassified Pseudomonas]MDY7561359.1 SDR family oxidoreductase [Pseudomonas sp. AB6]MEA9978499.1 SDR family oxidoreductase [Pseudomonas sp. RTS4]MEA9996768.1 SDR family oxidoreductase [Pseudomonas sp. AA4]MEB0088879.1 SDR family oxidoreductase [Pseudomonas sp. RTI1]MEB0128262.1 SDR family oxidoreductase [Pseudomonas sp. CCC1.2]
MQTTGNTLLVTGGGSGIGRALAEAFLALGNEVIIAGRRESVLKQVVQANPGLHYAVLDTTDSADTQRVAEQLIASYPKLNAVIHCAGIMRGESLRAGATELEATVATNLLGPIRLDGLLLPHFLKQPHAAIVTVSSGLAFVPLALTPSYCATKAAVHSYTQSLRYQLKDTAVNVHELVPPYVQTELMGDRQANDPHAMPLKDFIDEVMGIFQHSPDADEILVERVKPLRFAEVNGGYEQFFKNFNDQMAAARAGE